MGSSSSKRTNYWPTCTMLMILCPDLMNQVVLKKDGSSSKSNKKKFFDNLSKGLSSSKLSDVTTVCYVDICKASTYVSKSSESALRFLVTNTENELIGRLFNAQAAMKSETSFNETLMTDFLLSSFYLSPRKIISSLFAECVKNSSPQLFKRVFVNTLLRITNEISLPWNPTISDVYGAHATNLRQLFQDLLPKVKEYNSIKNATDKKGKAALEKVLADISILEKLIELYNCVSEFSIPNLSKVANQTLVVLHHPDNIKKWLGDTENSTNNNMERFW